MMKAMLSQPMAGKTDEEIIATREKAVAALKAKGYEIVNTLFTDEWYSSESMKKRGVVVSGGQDLIKGKIFRIGTMGMCSSGDILRTIQTLELILAQEGKIASCGAGVEAASRVLYK